MMLFLWAAKLSCLDCVGFFLINSVKYLHSENVLTFILLEMLSEPHTMVICHNTNTKIVIFACLPSTVADSSLITGYIETKVQPEFTLKTTKLFHLLIAFMC